MEAINIYTRAEVAAKFRVSERTIFRLEKEGKAKPHNIGSKIRYTDDDIAALIKNTGFADTDPAKTPP